MQNPTFTKQHLEECVRIIRDLDLDAIEGLVSELSSLRERAGRMFMLGVGGSAANCSHAVNDFRKLAGIEAYAPTDNVAELTARINDEGWNGAFVGWLKGSRLCSKDLLFILSVGGGDRQRNISVNLIEAITHARAVGARVAGIVGRDGGFTAQEADSCVIIPTANDASVTPHTESFQSVVLHLLVSHPAIQLQSAKWESVKGETEDVV